MKKFEELGLTFLSPKSKEGDKSTTSALHAINDIVYERNKNYADAATAAEVAAQLTEIGVRLSEAETYGKAQAKKNEILSYLRATIRSLRAYSEEFILTKADEPQVFATTKFITANYLKAKEEDTLTDENIIKLLKECNRIRERIIAPLSLNYPSFKKIPGELLNILKNRYVPAENQI